MSVSVCALSIQELRKPSAPLSHMGWNAHTHKDGEKQTQKEAKYYIINVFVHIFWSSNKHKYSQNMNMTMKCPNDMVTLYT